MCDISRTVFLIYSSILFIYKSHSFDFIDEGSSCQIARLKGICRQIKDCQIAINSLKMSGRHSLTRCGFVDDQEVVCCPDASERSPIIETTTLESGVIWTGNEVDRKPSKETEEDIDNKGRLNTKRKCEKACEKILKTNNVKPKIDFHIINGEDATLGEFPHMAALGFLNLDGTDGIDWKICGASLIHNRFLLTAAHCFIQASRPSLKMARFGIVDLKSTNDAKAPQDIATKNFTVHPNYEPSSRHNDIALVELEKDVVTSSNTYPACLYVEDDEPLGMIVTGWGQTEIQNGDQRSDILQKAALSGVPTSKCRSDFAARSTTKTIVETQICATGNGTDACQGDSGGPLQIVTREGGYSLVGIISYGAGCGSKIPGVYTRVSRYINWIESVVWPD